MAFDFHIMRSLIYVGLAKEEYRPKPDWAEQESFPFLKPDFHIASMFLGDIATMDAYSQYHGYITMR